MIPGQTYYSLIVCRLCNMQIWVNEASLAFCQNCEGKGSEWGKWGMTHGEGIEMGEEELNGEGRGGEMGKGMGKSLKTLKRTQEGERMGKGGGNGIGKGLNGGGEGREGFFRRLMEDGRGRK